MRRHGREDAAMPPGDIEKIGKLMKIGFWVCLIVLAAASLAAWRMTCADEEPGRRRLVWVSDPNPFRAEQIAIFNRRYPDLRLTLDPGNLEMEKIIVQSVAGVGPDVFDVSGLYVLKGFAEAGIALDLTDLARQYGFAENQTWPGLADYLKVDGRQYSFPGNVYANVIFYNKNLFDKYGVPYPPRDMTWEQFVEIGRRLTRRSPDGRGFQSFGAMNIYWYELVLQAGGRMFRPDGLRCELASPAAVEAIRFYDDLMHKYHIMPTPAEETAMGGEGGWGDGYLNWFGAGRLGMIRISRWGLITFRRFEALKGRLGVCHQPYLRRKVCLIGAKLIAVNRYSRNLDGAMKFMTFLASPEFNRQVVSCADYLPPVPAFARSEEFLHDPKYPQEDFNDVFVEAVERGVPPEVSPFVEPLAALEVINRQLDLMACGSKPPEQACRDMTRGVNRLIYQNLCRYDKFRQRYKERTGREFSADDPRWRDFKEAR